MRKAVELRPDFAQAIYNLANALREQGQFDEAAATYRRAIQLMPDLMQAYNNLGNLLKDCGQLDEAIACYDQAMRRTPDDPARHSNRLYAMLFHPAFSARLCTKLTASGISVIAGPLKKLIRPHENNRDPRRRLRVGYVSPNFCDHVVGRNILPLFQERNRDEIEIYCYADALKSDSLTEKFRSSCDAWRNILGLPDERVAGTYLRRQD